MRQVFDVTDLYGALSDLARRYQFRSRDEVCCYGITVSQCYALEALAENGTLTASGLAGRLGLDLSSTTRIVDQLVRRKLALRSRAARDARVRELQITESGEKIVGQVRDDVCGVLRESLAGVPPDLLGKLPDIIRRITAGLCESCAKPAVPAARERPRAIAASAR